MGLHERRREIQKLKASQDFQDDLIIQDDSIKRRAAWAEKMRSATRATQLYQKYCGSADRFTMTFLEFKKVHAKAKAKRTNW